MSVLQSSKPTPIFMKFNSKKESYTEYLSRLLFNSTVTPPKKVQPVLSTLTQINKQVVQVNDSVKIFKKANSERKRLNLQLITGPALIEASVMSPLKARDVCSFMSPQTGCVSSVA